MNKLIFSIVALSLTLTACGSRHSRSGTGKAPVKLAGFNKTEAQLTKELQSAWGKEWDAKDPKSQKLASEISGVGVVTNSRNGDLENVTVTIVHTDCAVADVKMIQSIKPGPVVQTISTSEKSVNVGFMSQVDPLLGNYVVKIKCVSANQSCDDYTMLITKLGADNNPEGSVAVMVRQSVRDFNKAGDEKSNNEHSQIFWAKSSAAPMSASKALAAKAASCGVNAQENKPVEPPMYSEGE